MNNECKTQNIVVLKIGGSMLDIPPIHLARLMQVFNKIDEGIKIIVTVGGGPLLERARRESKAIREIHKLSAYPDSTIYVRNIEIISELLNRSFNIVTTGNKTDIIQSLKSGIITLVPRIRFETFNRLPRQTICPPLASDLFSIALACEFEAIKCIFIKNAPGVCNKDPELPANRKKKALLMDKPINVDKEKRDTRLFLYRQVNIDQLKVFKRGEHLLDDNSVVFLKRNKINFRIHFIDGKKPDQLIQILNDGDVGTKLIMERETYAH